MDKLMGLAEILNHHGFNAEICSTGQEASDRVCEIIENRSVGFGSSKTIDTLGIYERLLSGGNSLYWHWKSQPTETLFQAASSADVYLSSANAITEDGDIINIDKSGNRVSNTFYGPKTVIFVIGRNKLCRDLTSGIHRIKNTVCPLNARRLSARTPCAVTGKCTDCNSPDRLCRTITILQRPSASVETVHVLLVDADLGL